MPAETIIGDLLECDTKYIVHQTNCTSSGGAAGIAYEIFKKFPYSDIYKTRFSPDKPGTIIVKGNGEWQRYVINLMGQYFPGGPQENAHLIDSGEIRKEYFFSGLQAIARINNIESIAFPDHVGCGIANGDWNFYEKLINKFADYIHKEQGAKTYIYKLPAP